MLLMDSILARNLDAALVNIKQGAGGFKQNMDAAGHNFLLRGYLKKKAAEANGYFVATKSGLATQSSPMKPENA